jgi:hypothetical protein
MLKQIQQSLRGGDLLSPSKLLELDSNERQIVKGSGLHIPTITDQRLNDFKSFPRRSLAPQVITEKRNHLIRRELPSRLGFATMET